MKAIKQTTIAFVILCSHLLFGSAASAHFIFVYGEDGKIKVVFGESTDPDQAKFLGGLSSMKAFTYVDGQKKTVAFEKITEGDDGWFQAEASDVGSVVDVACPYGVFGRGDKTMFLDYSAKFVRYSPGSLSKTPSKDLSLDLIPEFENGQLKVSVFFKGMPLGNAEVKLELMEYESFTTATDDTGVATLAANTRYVVRAKHTEAVAGEIDGKKFSEKQFYCTMVLDLGAESTVGESGSSVADTGQPSGTGVTLQRVDRGYQEFPRGMTSFGATVLEGKIYVAGGKSGRAHRYARSYQNNDVYCLDLSGKQWSTAGDTLGLQGLAIVAHGGKIIRIGGLEVRNEEGEEHQLRSIAAVKSFDPETKKWTTLPSLPQGRSSFDACVHDNRIFVVGGWTMELGEEPEWAEDMLVLDLSSENARWQSIEAPFMTRALAVRAFDNRIFAIGGIEAAGGPAEYVHVYDVESGQWESGPDLPCNEGMKGFGCSAVAVGGHFFVSTYDGGIYCLSDDQSSWEKVHQLEMGRFFHQMLPAGPKSFAIVGGSHMKHGNQNEVIVLSVSEVDETKVSAIAN